MAKRAEGDWIVGAILGGLAAVLLLMAAVFGVLGWSFASTVAATKAWPTTEGVVVKHEVTEYDYRDPKNGQLYKRSKIDFAYSYEVAGKSYTGTRFNVSGAGRPMADYEPLGAAVVVHYDPADPATAGLSVEGAAENPAWFYASGALAALGAVLAFFGARSFLRWRAASRSSAT